VRELPVRKGRLCNGMTAAEYSDAGEEYAFSAVLDRWENETGECRVHLRASLPCESDFSGISGELFLLVRWDACQANTMRIEAPSPYFIFLCHASVVCHSSLTACVPLSM